MLHLTWRQRAIADLDEIYDYIAEDAPDRATESIRKLVKAAELLRSFPDLGVSKLKSNPELRIYPFQNYLIIYQPKIKFDRIEIVRIIHGARDYFKLLEDSDDA